MQRHDDEQQDRLGSMQMQTSNRISVLMHFPFKKVAFLPT